MSKLMVSLALCVCAVCCCRLLGSWFLVQWRSASSRCRYAAGPFSDGSRFAADRTVVCWQSHKSVAGIHVATLRALLVGLAVNMRSAFCMCALPAAGGQCCAARTARGCHPATAHTAGGCHYQLLLVGLFTCALRAVVLCRTRSAPLLKLLCQRAVTQQPQPRSSQWMTCASCLDAEQGANSSKSTSSMRCDAAAAAPAKAAAAAAAAPAVPKKLTMGDLCFVFGG
jgi:hypothetical protein